MPTERKIDTNIMFDTYDCAKSISEFANSLTYSAEEAGNAFKQISNTLCAANDFATDLTDRVDELEKRLNSLELEIKNANPFLRNINWGW